MWSGHFECGRFADKAQLNPSCPDMNGRIFKVEVGLSRTSYDMYVRICIKLKGTLKGIHGILRGTKRVWVPFSKGM